MIAIAAILVGYVAGVLAGGDYRAVAGIHVRHPGLILAAFVLQAFMRGRVFGTAATGWGLVGWTAVTIVLVVLLLSDASTPGVPLVIAGLLLNLDVTFVNGGMPVAAPESTRAVAAVVASAGFYHIAGSTTLLAWAADVIPVTVLGVTEYVSVGDLLLGVGVVTALAATMLRQPGAQES